jgi:hypothetical protein
MTIEAQHMEEPTDDEGRSVMEVVRTEKDLGIGDLTYIVVVRCPGCHQRTKNLLRNKETHKWRCEACWRESQTLASAKGPVRE